MSVSKRRPSDVVALTCVASKRTVTHVYQWFSLPRLLVVRCPACRGPASLRTPELAIGASLKGELCCDKCHHSAKNFTASWPKDAYFLFSIRGHELWAWSEAHARAIRDYIASETRNRREHRGFVVALLHLPEYFLRAKNRTATVRCLDRLLDK